MNVSTIKTLCWLLSAVAFLGLAAYGAQFARDIEAKQNPVNRDYVKAVLEERVEIAPDVKAGLRYQEQVKPDFIDMNWTGKEAPKKVVTLQPSDDAPKPKYKPIKDVLRILYLQVDLNDPGGSMATVTYLGSGEDGELMVGDTLPKPNDFAVVHVIDADGVEFAFKDTDRENERVQPRALDDETLIVTVDENGVVKAPKRREIPKAIVRRSDNPKQTELIAKNNYRLGQEDLQYFNQNYADILTNDVRTSTYYDENGKRAGIEIKEVKSGSIASRHGAQDGDVIISINGNPVSSEQEAIKFVKNNQENYSAWEVVVLRYGKKETIIYNNPD